MQRKVTNRNNEALPTSFLTNLEQEIRNVAEGLADAVTDPIEEACKRLERAQRALEIQMERMNSELAKQDANPSYQIPLGVYLDYGVAKQEYATAQKDYKRLQREQVKTHAETVEELKKQYRELEKAEQKAREGSETEWRIAKANLDKARRALAKEGVSVRDARRTDGGNGSEGGSNKKKGKDATLKEQDRRIENERKIAMRITRLREDMEAIDIKNISDATEQKVRLLETDRKRRIASIEETHSALVRLRGGMLTEEEESVFAEAREHAYNTENRRLDALLRDVMEKDKAAMRKYLALYGNWEERRSSVHDIYQERISEATTDGEKKILEQRMNEELSNLDMERLKKSIDWEDLVTDIERHSTDFLNLLRDRLQEALSAKEITDENARIVSEKINEIDNVIASKGNIWETLLPAFGLRQQLQRALKLALEEGDEARARSLLDQLGESSGLKSVFGWLSGSPLEVLNGVNRNVQSLDDLMGTLGLGNSGFGEAVHQFAEGSSAFMGAIKSLVSGDIIGVANGVVKGFQSWGKVLGIGNNSNAEEVARVTEQNTASNERLTLAVEHLKETMDKQNGAAAVNSFQEAMEAQKRIISQQMEILRAQMGYHGAHHSNAYKFNLDEESYGRISMLLGRNIDNLDDLYALSPEEMDAIRRRLTDVWQSITTQGSYDKSKYWEQYADLAGSVAQLTEQINENLTQTSFQSLRNDFVNTLMDMDADAADFSHDFAERMQRSLVNMAVGNTIDRELEEWYSRWAERLQKGTLTAGELAHYKSEYDALVEKGLAQRDTIAQLTGYDLEAREAEGTRGAFKSMSQTTGEELGGRLTAIQLQTSGLTEMVKLQAEDIRRMANTCGDSFNLMNEMNEVVWQCSTYLETIARNSGYMPSMDKKLDRIRDAVERL